MHLLAHLENPSSVNALCNNICMKDSLRGTTWNALQGSTGEVINLRCETVITRLFLASKNNHLFDKTAIEQGLPRRLDQARPLIYQAEPSNFLCEGAFGAALLRRFD